LIRFFRLLAGAPACLPGRKTAVDCTYFIPESNAQEYVRGSKHRAEHRKILSIEPTEDVFCTHF
jgi:hypothetical protein